MFCRMKTLCIKSNEKIYTHQQRLFSSVAGINRFCDNIFPRISAYPKAILSNKRLLSPLPTPSSFRPHFLKLVGTQGRPVSIATYL